MNTKDSRDPMLDILKGVGILLVVFGHVCKNEESKLIYLFHMPLFFFLSGAALNYSRNRDINLVKRFKHIMVPYFVFSVICFLYWCFVEIRFRPLHNTSLFNGWLGLLDYRWQQFANIFVAFNVKGAFMYNAVLWFLPCLYMALIIFIAIRKYMGIYAVIGFVIITSIPFLFINLRLPWCTDTACAALPFIMVGNILWGTVKKGSWISIVVGGLLAIILIYFFVPQVSMKAHKYGEWWLFYLVAFSLICAICGFCKYLVGKDLHILEWLGRNSLAIMCIHEPVKRVLLVIISNLSGMEIAVIRGSGFISLGITFLCILLLVPIVICVNKYFPFLLGKERHI